jgi:hypothetical protein
LELEKRLDVDLLLSVRCFHDRATPFRLGTLTCPSEPQRKRALGTGGRSRRHKDRTTEPALSLDFISGQLTDGRQPKKELHAIDAAASLMAEQAVGSASERSCAPAPFTTRPPNLGDKPGSAAAHDPHADQTRQDPASQGTVDRSHTTSRHSAHTTHADARQTRLSPAGLAPAA